MEVKTKIFQLIVASACLWMGIATFIGALRKASVLDFWGAVCPLIFIGLAVGVILWPPE